MSRITLILLFLFGGLSLSYAQSITDSITTDPQIRSGNLPNGFSYYLQKNNSPAQKMEFRFIVKAGTMNEEPDQMELAHLLEHMAMRGTIHFPKGFVSYFEKKGLRGGLNLNANTSSISTTYSLFDIPVTDAELVDSCFYMLKDLAHGLELKPEKIDIERGAILAESRGIDFSMQDYFAAILKHPKYSKGLIEQGLKNIQEFKQELLFRFYNTWYQPRFQGVVIVGDIDIDKTEKRIHAMFSSLSSPTDNYSPTVNTNEFAVKLNGANNWISYTDDEIKGLRIEVFQKKEGLGYFGKLFTRQQYKEQILGDLYNNIVARRFKALSDHHHESVFGKSDHGIVRAAIKSEAQVDALHSYLTVDSFKYLKQRVQAFFTEVERIRQWGFSNDELSWAKADFLTNNKEPSNVTNRQLANNLRNHFIYGEPVLTPAYRKELYSSIINSISPEEFNKFSNEWNSQSVNTDIVVTTSGRNENDQFAEAEIKDVIKEVKANKLSSFQYPQQHELPALFPTELVKKVSTTVKYQESETEETGVNLLKLENGLLVVFKNTKPEGYKGSNISLQVFSPGGFSQHTGIDKFAVAAAPQIIAGSGVGNFNQKELNTFNQQKNISIAPYVNELEEGFEVFVPSENLESALQLVYLYWTAPKADTAYYDKWVVNRLKTKSDIIKEEVNFADTINYYTGNIGTHANLNTPLPGKIDPGSILKLYTERFSTANDFTVVLAGAVDYETAKPLLIKYFGNIPATHKKDKVVSLPYQPFNNRIHKSIYSEKQKAGSANVRMLYTGQFDYSQVNNIFLEVVNELVRRKLFQVMRTKNGWTYGVSSTVNYSQFPDSRYQFQISYEGATDSISKMIAKAKDEIIKLQDDIADEDFDNTITAVQAKFQRDLTGNQFWLRYLVDQYRFKSNPFNIKEREAILKMVTKSDIKKTIQKYLSDDQYSQFVLLPKKTSIQTKN